MKTLATFQEEKFRYSVEFLQIPIEDLQVIPVQRKPSKPHVKRLLASIGRIGFVVPAIVIERKGKFFIIDGQHRFLAAKEARLKSLPCLKIPEQYAHHLMELNVEKQMNLREKCYVALNVIRMYLEEDPKIEENDPRILDSIEQGYFVTIGLAYEKNLRLSGSSWETMLKKVDLFTTLPLPKAMEERRRRSSVLLEAHDRAQECVGAIKKLGINHPFIYKEIVSFANPYKRKRKVSDTFDGLMSKVRQALEELRDKPEQFRKHKFSGPAE
jgi:ParB family chromosome partitioning protein